MSFLKTACALTTLTCAFTSALTSSAYAEETDPVQEETKINVGVRVGAGVAIETSSAPMSMANLYSDIRFSKGRYFLQIAPGLYLPGSNGNLSYGGLGFEVGGGMLLSRAPISPYVGAGAAGRLLWSESAGAGFAPYAQIGINSSLADDLRLYVEARVYQNVIPIGRNLLPTEVGGAVGVMF